MKWTPFVSAVLLGATTITAVHHQWDARIDGAENLPAATASMQGHHHHHHPSYTGSHPHMSGTMTRTMAAAAPDGAQPTTGGAPDMMKHKRRHGGDPAQQGREHLDHTRRPNHSLSSGGHHSSVSGGMSGPSLVSIHVMPTAAAEVHKRSGDGRHRGGRPSHEGGRHTGTGGAGGPSVSTSTVLRTQQTHVPTTFTKMMTARGA